MTSPTRPAAGRHVAALAAMVLALSVVGPARADQTPPSGGTILADLVYPTGPQYIAMEPWMTQTGWDIREIVFTYYAKTDTLDVDIKTTGIAGDADGLGIPGGNDPKLAAVGGINPANLGGRDSIDVAFNAANANGTMGAPVAIAGVPEYKAANAPNDGFQLSQYSGNGNSLESAYGAPITNAVGTLLYSPSAAHPDFEFTISNFSQIAGLNLSSGFYFNVYAGSPDDVVAGEDHIGGTFVGDFQPLPQVINPQPAGWLLPPPLPTPTPPPHFQAVPEPSSVALLGVGGGLAAWVMSRKRRAVAS